MLIIFEGLDRSGKSTLSDIVKQILTNDCNVPCVSIRKQYCKQLYPIDFGKASMYDWQAILDRVVLANNDVMFIADRSFVTQAAYQFAIGTGNHAMTEEQYDMTDNYCEVCNANKFLTVYCKSNRFELDNLVASIAVRQSVDHAYQYWLSKLSYTLQLDMDSKSIYELATIVVDKVKYLMQDKIHTNITNITFI